MGQQSYVVLRVHNNAKKTENQIPSSLCVTLSKNTTKCITPVFYLDFDILLLFNNFIIWIWFLVFVFSICFSLEEGDLMVFSPESSSIW